MATRTVRLDAESEQLLKDLQRTTGESVSTVLKRGLAALRDMHHAQIAKNPFEIYEKLELGPGGYGRAPARKAKESVRSILQQKRTRR